MARSRRVRRRVESDAKKGANSAVRPGPAHRDLSWLHAGGAAVAEADQVVPSFESRRRVQQIGRLLGNRAASQMVSHLQRHSGHDEFQGPAMRLVSPSIMRAEMLPESTDTATINAAAAPADLLQSAPLAGLFGWAAWAAGFAPTSLGQLAAGDRVRTLEPGPMYRRVHVESGAQRGKIGWLANTSITGAAAPTSQRDPTAGPENAYTQLQTALAAVPPSRSTILFIIQTRLTMAQHQQLLAAGNPEWAQIMALAALSANDVMHIHQVLGSRLRRRLTDYLAKGGTTMSELRLAFATATDEERLEVARDDAMMGQVRRLLSGTHPEVVLGTVISTLYPPDGKLATFLTTNPELGAWLRGATPRAQRSGNITTAAAARASGLQGALQAMIDRGDAPARQTVMAAVRAAPRGAALPDAERTALDAIEERAYEANAYTVPDIRMMFLTRWGRPFLSTVPKTFLHRLWTSIERLPAEHILLNNVLGFFDLNADPSAAGSFTDFLSSANFGRLVSDPPPPETLHAVAPVNGRRIQVLEASVDLLTPGHQLAVTQADGTIKNVNVVSVHVPTRRVRVNQNVNVAAGGELRPPEATAVAAADALRVTAPAAMFADNAGAPNLGNQLGVLQPGNLFSDSSRTVVGGKTYVGGQIHAGPLAGQQGWIELAHTSALDSGTTMAQEEFEWTARHEMGHSLDLELNGFSRFSQASTAEWRKYPGATDWTADLITVAGIANPDTNQVLNGVNANFRLATRIFSQAVQDETTADANPQRALNWLTGWVAAGGSQNVFDVVTQFNADANYYNRNNRGLPPLNGRIFGAHYNEYFSAADQARTESLAVGVPPYGYTCTYEFFADHYAAYTSPGSGGEQYARAVPVWAQNFFDRMVGVAGAGPAVGMNRRRMGP